MSSIPPSLLSLPRRTASLDDLRYPSTPGTDPISQQELKPWYSNVVQLITTDHPMTWDDSFIYRSPERKIKEPFFYYRSTIANYLMAFLHEWARSQSQSFTSPMTRRKIIALKTCANREVTFADFSLAIPRKKSSNASSTIIEQLAQLSNMQKNYRDLLTNANPPETLLIEESTEDAYTVSICSILQAVQFAIEDLKKCKQDLERGTIDNEFLSRVLGMNAGLISLGGIYIDQNS